MAKQTDGDAGKRAHPRYLLFEGSRQRQRGTPITHKLQARDIRCRSNKWGKKHWRIKAYEPARLMSQFVGMRGQLVICTYIHCNTCQLIAN